MGSSKFLGFQVMSRGAAKVFQVLCPVSRKTPCLKTVPHPLGFPVGTRWKCSSRDKTGSTGVLRLEITYSFFSFLKNKIKLQQPPQIKAQFLAGTRPLLLLLGRLLG